MNTVATVTDRGAVLLGKNVACDAFDETRALRVVTHAHSDHMKGLQQSLKICEKTLMTTGTKDLIDVLRSPLFLMGGYVETLDYGETLEYGDDKITFFPADHILGASQVLVEDVEGKRAVFTGDFKIDNTPVLNADVLVIEATYGNPMCRRSFEKDVKCSLVSIVEKGLKHGTVRVFGYHGKLQEVMQILREADVDVPFLAPERIYYVSKVCERHGMNLGQVLLSTEEGAMELLKRNSQCVAFHHMVSSKKNIKSKGFRISVSGWEFSSAIRQTADKEYVVALSDHSDFYGLLEYVRLSKPRFVITDNSRVRHGETLAKEIRKRFSIPAVALPKR